MLELTGATVTIDAMGCQKQIAQQIKEQKAHYILDFGELSRAAVKDNQPTLHEKVGGLLDEAILDGFKDVAHGYFEKTEQGHGRIENRRVWVSTDLVKSLDADLLRQWPGLASVAVVESTRQDLGDLSGKISVQRRYFISSHDKADADLFARAIRQQWCVENQLHWRLDVSMNEDQCRLRTGCGAENFSRLRRIALNKLKRWEMKKANGKVRKLSLRLKQKACGWSRKFLIEALLA